jgi:DNA repair exonuclease SbcCD ATPase subunit
VVKHEHFEELCAAASIGQATPEELFELEQHAADCEACQKAYWDYLNLAARQFAEREDTPRLSSREAQECLNSELFTRRFFERADKEGIVFSQVVREETRKLSPQPEVLPRKPWWPKPALALAAAIAVVAMISTAFFYGKKSVRAGFSSAPTQPNSGVPIDVPVLALNQRMAELAAANVKLQAQMDELKAELRQANVRLSASDGDLQSASQNRQQLEAQRDTLDAKVQNLQQELTDSQAAISKAQQEAAKLQEHSNDLQNTVVADRAQIQDLTDELKDKSNALDKERQLLAVGHDVTDLMGARNLHIVDVVDTDPRGKTRPAFGRIFFTEGKSLLFYAYDLNENKIQKADFQYRVWARKEGQDKQVRSLGIFYSDDKSQRRWVFKCTDPKVLNEIDSVFVTLEPQGDPSHPRGPNLMYAYLRGQPNHP